jgi:DNA-binding winged helix-turn-helix (wHTH) protein/Tol biopolymer transport system component
LARIVEYEFGPWTFYPERYLLISSGIEKELDPLSYKLLSYFLEHGKRVVPREELILQVWQQKFVDDNAINRAISELRKQLKHIDHQAPLIKTHHKKGYSVATDVLMRSTEDKGQQSSRTVEENNSPEAELNVKKHSIEKEPENNLKKASFIEENATQKNRNKHAVEKSSLNVKSISITITVVLLAFIFYILSSSSLYLKSIFLSDNANAYHAKNVTTSAATWNPGAEYSPLISHDGKYLAYMNHLQGQDTSFVKRLDDQKQIPLVVKDSTIRVLSWQAKSNSIVASVTNKGTCHFSLFDLSLFPEVPFPKRLIPCGKLVNNSAQLDVKSNTLYFVKKIKGYSGAGIYQYNLNTQVEDIVIPASNNGYGVLHSELSSDGKGIAYLTADIKKGPMKAHLFDLTKREHSVLLELEFELNSLAINWSLDNNNVIVADYNKLHYINIENRDVKTVILPEGTRPYNLEVEKEQQILFTPYVLRDATLVKAENLFDNNPPIFTELYPSDKHSYGVSLDPKQSSDLYYEKSTDIFFASDRSGSHQVWQVHRGNLIQISDLVNATEELGPPIPSHNGKFILFRHNQQLKIIRLKDKMITTLSELPKNVAHYLWSTNDSAVVYSKEVNNANQIWQFDLLTRKKKLLAEQGGDTMLDNAQGSIFYIHNGFLVDLMDGMTKRITLPVGISRFRALTRDYLYNHDAFTTMYRMNINTGKIDQAEIPLAPGTFTVKPDDSAILFTKFTLQDTYIQRLTWQ